MSSAAAIPPAAFYCVSDSRYFLGAVAMVNSLRLVGHDEPIYLLDCGLTTEQRELIGAEATVVPAPADLKPHLQKTVAPLRHPAETMVLIDVDMIVTRRLDELIRRAGEGEGQILAFAMPEDRFVPEWGELLGLGQARKRRYLCSGFIALERRIGEQVLRLVDESQKRADFERNFVDVNWLRESVDDSPFAYLDQDVFNAVLATRVPPQRVIDLEPRLAPLPPFVGLRPVDAEGLRCAYADGTEPYLLHHIFPGKPWIQPMPGGLYTRLLTRLLVGPGLALKVPRSSVPMRLREGRSAAIVRTAEELGLRLRLFIGLWSARARRFGRRLFRREAAVAP